MTFSAPLGEDESRVFRQNTFGLSVPLYAFLMAIISGLPLPIGAYIGVKLAPIDPAFCAALIALGSGALLFAVTVELYASLLDEIRHGHAHGLEIGASVGGALVGALFYLYTNRWITSSLDPNSPMILETLEAPTETTPLLGTEPTANEASPRTANYDDEVGATVPGATTLQPRRQCCGDVESGPNAETLAPQKSDNTYRNDAKIIAFGLFLGFFIDGIPEGVLLGFLAAEGRLSPVLIISLILTNFPGALSSSSLLKEAKMSTSKIIGIWLSLCILTGCLSGLSCELIVCFFPNVDRDGVQNLPFSCHMFMALAEGIASGAMIACIASVMLPEALAMSGKDGSILISSGFLCVCGFLLSVTLKAIVG